MESLLPREEASIHQNYRLKVTVAIPIGTGAMSSTMALHTDRGKLFLKRYKPASDLNLNPSSHRPRIAFTHAVQDCLWERDFPIPSPPPKPWRQYANNREKRNLRDFRIRGRV